MGVPYITGYSALINTTAFAVFYNYFLMYYDFLLCEVLLIFLILVVQEYCKFHNHSTPVLEVCELHRILQCFHSLHLGLVGGSRTLIRHWSCEQKMPTGSSLSLK